MATDHVAEVRAFFERFNGRATLKELYDTLLPKMVEGAIWSLSGAVEKLQERGELAHDKWGVYVYTRPKTGGSGPSGTAAVRMWRAAHQLTHRQGNFGQKALAELAGVAERGAGHWLKAMREAGHLDHNVYEGKYRVGPQAPHRDDPPPFTWPRRGKAKTKSGRANA